MESIDIALLDEAELAKWLFDRPVPEDIDDFHGGYSFDTDSLRSLLVTLTSLLSNLRVYSTKFSREQIDRGLWAILGGGSFNVGGNLAKSEIPLSIRVAFLESIYRVYADVVAFLPLPFIENCYEMCWDLVCTAFWSEVHRAPFIPPVTPQEIDNFFKSSESEMCKMSEAMQKIAQQSPGERAHAALAARVEHAEKDFTAKLTPDQTEVRNAIFTTLCRILTIDNLSCQHAALHGLSHLHHPGVAAVVQNYIEFHAGKWSREMGQWLEACRDGTAM